MFVKTFYSKQGVLCLLILVMGWKDVRGQEYRENLSIATQQAFGGMLRYAGQGNYPKLEKAMMLIEPLVEALSRKEGADYTAKIKEGIAAGDKAAVLNWVQKLVASDIKDLLNEASTTSQVQVAKKKLRGAFEDYSLLEPFVKAKDAKANQQIKMDFKKLMIHVGKAPDDFAKGKDAILNTVFSFL